MKYALFLGCFIPVRLPHLELIARDVLPELGIELVEINDFTCCPEPVGFLADNITGLAISARNISIAEEKGLNIITLCNGCTYSLKKANHVLKENSVLRGKVNEILEQTNHVFSGNVRVKHFAQVLLDEVGINLIKSKVKKPLNNIKIACHTGCHILNPSNVMGFDNPLDPTNLDRLVEALGAQPVYWDKKTVCCGWTLTNYGQRESAGRLLEEKFNSISRAKADFLTVICPQCFNQFDRSYLYTSHGKKNEWKTPTLFYLQLLALALGRSIEDIKLSMHRIRNAILEDKLRRVIS